MSDNPIQQSELWEIARRIVSFNTVSAASNVEAAEYLATFLEDSNFSVRILKETVQVSNFFSGLEKIERIIHEWCITREELVLRGR